MAFCNLSMCNCKSNSLEALKLVGLDADVQSSVPSLLACLTVQIDMIQRSVGARRRILQQKAEVCLLALECFKESWPFIEKMHSMFQSRLDSVVVEEQSEDPVQDSGSKHAGLDMSSGLVSPFSQLPVDNISADGLTSTAGLGCESSMWLYPSAYDNPASPDIFSYGSVEGQLAPMDSFDLIDRPIDRTIMGLEV